MPRPRPIATLLFLILLGLTPRFGCAQNIPAWFPKPSPLPPASGNVVPVSDAEQILTAGEAMTPGTTMMIEPGVYTLPQPLILRQKQNITIRSVSGEPASVTLKGKGWEVGDKFDDILRVADCDGVTIAGLTFAECRSYGIKVEAENAPKNIQGRIDLDGECAQSYCLVNGKELCCECKRHCKDAANET